MAEMGHKHRISVLLSQPLCRKWRQYLPKFVRCSEDHQVPNSDSCTAAKISELWRSLQMQCCPKQTGGACCPPASQDKRRRGIGAHLGRGCPPVSSWTGPGRRRIGAGLPQHLASAPAQKTPHGMCNSGHPSRHRAARAPTRDTDRPPPATPPRPLPAAQAPTA
jgi:hypothetical protein